MPSELVAGLIIGGVAALPYLAFVAVGLLALLRRGGPDVLAGTVRISGAACGAVLAGVALAYLLFFVMRVTSLTDEPSGLAWGLGLAVPALIVGWIAFLGMVQDDRPRRFDYLLVGLFLGIFGFCGLPVGLVVLLAGLIFGLPRPL